MLSASTLLNAWEAGGPQSTVERGLTLLGLAVGEASGDNLSEMSLGRRDWHLLGLHERLFGPRLEAIARCPKCGESLELAIDVNQIRVSADALDQGEAAAVVDGVAVRCRVPNSGDLLAMAGYAHSGQAQRELMSRCVVDRGAAQCLSESALSVIAATLAAADPQADVQLELACTACEHRWLIGIDIVSFLWTEIHGWAQRTLLEVHQLACAYGWAEAQILSLSAQRRQIYLQVLGGG